MKVIRYFPVPTHGKKIREFLGLVNFYRYFIPHGAAFLQSLNSLLAKEGKSAAVTWNDAADQAFEKVKESLAHAGVLAHPKSNAPSSVMVDAPDIAVGAVFEQFVDGTWRSISFFSEHLIPTECRYSTFGRDHLAVYLAVRHFRHFLEGRTFHTLADHKPLTFALTSCSSAHTPRETRHMKFISEFTLDIRFSNGNVNTTDYLGFQITSVP